MPGILQQIRDKTERCERQRVTALSVRADPREQYEARELIKREQSAIEDLELASKGSAEARQLIEQIIKAIAASPYNSHEREQATARLREASMWLHRDISHE